MASERALPLRLEQVTQAAPGNARPRLDYLDGLRAVAALLVIILHSYETLGLGIRLHDRLGLAREPGALTLSAFGRLISLSFPLVEKVSSLAVPIFIVISGYSLMLPLVYITEGTPKLDPIRFFTRRARRILPPYFAALLLSLLICAFVPGMNKPDGVLWDLALPALDVRSIVSHVFLIQNASGATEFTIDPPMWSIAVEWQIYLLFPLLVLIWRAWGVTRLLALALVVGVLPVYLPLTILPLSDTWFIGLFAIGMIGASIAHGRRPEQVRWRTLLPWGWVAIGAAGAIVVVPRLLRWSFGLLDPGWIGDYALAVAVAAALVFCANTCRGEPRHQPLLLRGLRQPWLVAIGGFSYSLYLLHVPVLSLVARASLSQGLPITTGYAIIFAAGIPLAFLASYLFFLVFERPFLSHGAARNDFATAPAEITARDVARL